MAMNRVRAIRHFAFSTLTVERRRVFSRKTSIGHSRYVPDRRSGTVLAYGVFGGVNIDPTTANSIVVRMQIMVTPEGEARLLKIEGVLHQVDVINRDVSVFATGGVATFDVPPGCTILLNGESVKLRLLQTSDHVRISYTHENAVRVAERIDAGTPREYYEVVGNSPEALNDDDE